MKGRERRHTAGLIMEATRTPYHFVLNSPVDRVDVDGNGWWAAGGVAVLAGAGMSLCCYLNVAADFLSAMIYAERLTGEDHEDHGNAADALTHCIAIGDWGHV